MADFLLKIKKMVPRRIRFWKHNIICNLKSRRFQRKRDEIFKKQLELGFSSIPIFLISFNRLSYIKSMIACLEEIGLTNIIVVDNASTYPPLLVYYNTLPYKIIRMSKNEGYRVFWKNPMFNDYRKRFYIVSDPDVEPIKECPKDFIEKFFDVLYKYPMARKVGFSLKIDDLPNNGTFTNQVIQWESKYYKTLIKKDNVYYADVDTTFALYVPDELVISGFREGFRTGYPYQARHIPWYKNPEEITEEDIYYSEHKTNGWWNVVAGQMTPDKEK